MIKCCYGCVAPKRHEACHEACHGHCPEYLAEKEQEEQKKAQDSLRRKVSLDIYQQRADMVAKARRRHGRL